MRAPGPAPVTTPAGQPVRAPNPYQAGQDYRERNRVRGVQRAAQVQALARGVKDPAKVGQNVQRSLSGYYNPMKGPPGPGPHKAEVISSMMVAEVMLTRAMGRRARGRSEGKRAVEEAERIVRGRKKRASLTPGRVAAAAAVVGAGAAIAIGVSRGGRGGGFSAPAWGGRGSQPHLFHGNSGPAR